MLKIQILLPQRNAFQIINISEKVSSQMFLIVVLLKNYAKIGKTV
jgi:hypothetical protein